MGRHKLRTMNTIVFWQFGNLNAQRYHDEILRPMVVPFIHRHHLMFQHDNAGPHVTRICTQFLEAENVTVLPRPAYSPDMSPIEHVWDALDRRVRRCSSSRQFPVNSHRHWRGVGQHSQATINSLMTLCKGDTVGQKKYLVKHQLCKFSHLNR